MERKAKGIEEAIVNAAAEALLLAHAMGAKSTTPGDALSEVMDLASKRHPGLEPHLFALSDDGRQTFLDWGRLVQKQAAFDNIDQQG